MERELESLLVRRQIKDNACVTVRGTGSAADIYSFFFVVSRNCSGRAAQMSAPAVCLVLRVVVMSEIRAINFRSYQRHVSGSIEKRASSLIKRLPCTSRNSLLKIVIDVKWSFVCCYTCMNVDS